MTLETDYLVIGAGAMGMAFADTIIAESNATVTIVDRRHRPGGHWNDAYSFVTLHQPSSFYGVGSLELSKGRFDERGVNAGLAELATGPEILAYYHEVMQQHLLPTGRVTYLPMHDWDDEAGAATSLLSGEKTEIIARRIVDATFLKTTVPSTHTPAYAVADGATVKPINALPSTTKPADGYVVIGAGKTGMDAIVWLLQHGAEADSIRWITPRDSWMHNRRTTQPDERFFVESIGAIANQLEAVGRSKSVDEVFETLEQDGAFLRIDQSVRPTMYHGATVSEAEVDLMRQVLPGIVRLGRVKRVEHDRVVLEHGDIPTTPDTLHIDCTARAVGNAEIAPVFDGKRITLQPVRSLQPVFSASFIAHVDASDRDEATKARLCQVVPLPNEPVDWLRAMAAGTMNQMIWGRDKELRDWLLNSRLDGFARTIRAVGPNDHERQAILDRMRAAAPQAMANLPILLNEVAAA
ncbi:MAG: NAD(P)-binding protein [Pseudomonadota bacterium]